MSGDTHGHKLGRRIAAARGLRIETRLSCPAHRQEPVALVVVFEGERCLWIKAGRSKDKARALTEIEESIAHHEGAASSPYRKQMLEHLRLTHAEVRQEGGHVWPDVAFPIASLDEQALVVASCKRCHRRVPIRVESGKVSVSL